MNENMSNDEMNYNRELGELSASIIALTKSVDSLRLEIIEDGKQRRGWEERHDGQGEGTTHAIIDRHISSHSMWLNIMKGMGILLSFLGLGNLWAWLLKIMEHK